MSFFCTKCKEKYFLETLTEDVCLLENDPPPPPPLKHLIFSKNPKKKGKKKKKGFIATGVLTTTTKKTSLQCVSHSDTLVLFYCSIVCLQSFTSEQWYLFGCFCKVQLIDSSKKNLLTAEILPQFIKHETDTLLDVLSSAALIFPIQIPLMRTK